MPETLKDAVVAAEDQSFWTNQGIDPKGILRAAFSNASGGVTQGASTITQQYVKVLYLTQERSWKRKVKEAILSLKIENQYSKDEVLEGYLNTIYFGRGAYGVQAAAQAYFEVDAKDLNLRQSAVLAALLNDPNDLDPANGKAREAGAQGPLPVRRRRDGRDGRDQGRGAATAPTAGSRTSPRSRARTRTAGRPATCSRWSRTSCCDSASASRRSTAAASR